MKVILFGASGMVGQGVLRECLQDPEVESVLSIGRSATGQQHPKLRELSHADFLNFAPIESQLAGYDACFYCLGVTSSGKTEAEYTRVTRDYTVAAAEAILRQNKSLTFIFVSGAGSDSTEKSRTMWARVKGRAENDVMKLPFKASFIFRPAYIQPLHGIESKTPSYRIMYKMFGWLDPVLKALAPRQRTSTEIIGKAMLILAKRGGSKQILECGDINDVVAAQK